METTKLLFIAITIFVVVGCVYYWNNVDKFHNDY